MVNAQKSGLIKRCLLAGAMALGNAGLTGCDTLDAQQTASLHGLMSFTQHGYWENERNEAIRDSKSEVNVYVGESQNDKSSYIYVKVEQYDGNWTGSPIFPFLKANSKTHQFAPKPGYIWEDPNNTRNFKVIPRINCDEIKDYEIKPKKHPKDLNVRDFKFN